MRTCVTGKNAGGFKKNAFGQKNKGALYEVLASYTPRSHAYVMPLQIISELVPLWKNLLNGFVETSVFLIKSMLIL